MATSISYGEKNSGFQAGVIHGDVGNVTIVQSETLNQECLRDLHATNPVDDKERIENTKGGLLKDSYRWILENKEFRQWQDSERNRLLWIRGDPGKGKTMLLCGIIEELARLYGDSANISFFFCQATDMRINSATSVLRGLIYLLVKKHPSLLHHVRARYDYAGKTLFEDVNAWNALSTIFRDILNDPTLQMTYLVIDALDECTNGLRFLLDLIVQESSANPQIKWVVSSRNWPEITERLDIATQLAPISLELNEASVSEAVDQFIQHKVYELAKAKRYSDKTRDGVQSYLLSNSQGTFLWVALVCQNLEKIRMNVLKKLRSFPPGLQALYGRMVDQVRESNDAKLCKEILAIMLTVFRPITLHELTSFIELPHDYDDLVSLGEIIAICGSFLTLQEHTIVFVHQSAKEYLLKEALSEILPRGIEAEHDMIFARSFDVIFKTLQRDIWNIKSPGLHLNEICKPSPNPLAAVEYACIYWVDHLEDSQHNRASELSNPERSRVDVFLQQKFLHWLEALSILGSVSNGIQAMQKLEVLIKHERPDWVLNDPGVEENWSFCLQVLEGHSDEVRSIAWSPDGSRLGSASHDYTIRIWDAVTGECVSTLTGHNSAVSSIAWSPDGSQLASASRDRTIKIWDFVTEQCSSTLKGHIHWISSIVWSPDGRQLASASRDWTVRIWDLVTKKCMLTLKDNTAMVNSIAWSPNGSLLASASDVTVKVWDFAAAQYTSNYWEHSTTVISIAWSKNDNRLASASYDTISIWDLARGQCISTIIDHFHRINSIAWSPDGSRLASALDDQIIRIWNSTSGKWVSTLMGHTSAINSIAWSPDGGRLASASLDKTIRIWEPVSCDSPSIHRENKDMDDSVAWLQDGNKLTIESYDTVTTRECNTNPTYLRYRRTDVVTSIAWSQDRSRFATASGVTIRIWDPATSKCLSTTKGHSNTVNSIAWSPDGSRLTSGSDDQTVRIWDCVNGCCILILRGHSSAINTVAWSPDGRQLASASRDETIRIWDPTSGHCDLALPIHSPDFVQFDKVTPNHLQTTVGTYDMLSASHYTCMPQCPTSSLNQYKYGLSDDSSWITCDGINLLWLPVEYRPARPSLLITFPTTLVIGCSSGRFIFFALSDNNPFLAFKEG